MGNFFANSPMEVRCVPPLNFEIPLWGDCSFTFSALDSPSTADPLSRHGHHEPFTKQRCAKGWVPKGGRDVCTISVDYFAQNIFGFTTRGRLNFVRGLGSRETRGFCPGQKGCFWPPAGGAPGAQHGDHPGRPGGQKKGTFLGKKAAPGAFPGKKGVFFGAPAGGTAGAQHVVAPGAPCRGKKGLFGPSGRAAQGTFFGGRGLFSGPTGTASASEWGVMRGDSLLSLRAPLGVTQKYFGVRCSII